MGWYGNWYDVAIFIASKDLDISFEEALKLVERMKDDKYAEWVAKMNASKKHALLDPHSPRTKSDSPSPSAPTPPTPPSSSQSGSSPDRWSSFYQKPQQYGTDPNKPVGLPNIRV